MAITRPRDNISTTAGSANPACSFATLPSAASCIIVGWASWDGAHTHNSVADNQGGTYTQVGTTVTVNDSGGGANVRLSLWRRDNISAPSGTFTVTCTASASCDSRIVIAEYAGVLSAALDQNNQASATSGTSATTSMTTTQNNDVLVGVVTIGAAGTVTITQDPTNLPTLVREDQDNSSNQCINLSERITTTAGSYTANWAISSGAWGCVAAALKDDGVAPSYPTYVGAGTAAFTATSGATLTPGLPTGWAADDIHILVAARSDNTAMNSLAGWTQIAALSGNNTIALRTEVWWRRAVAGDLAPAVVFGTSTVVRGARVYGIRGCPTTGSPFNTQSLSNNAASATVTFGTVTPSVANTFLLAAYTYEDDPSAASQMTGWTAFDVSASSLGNDLSMGAATRVWPISGAATGALTITVSGGTFANSVSQGILISLAPAAVGTNYPISLSGGLSLSGSLINLDKKVLAGAMGSTGAVRKLDSKPLAGVVGSIGNVNKRALIALSGSAGSVGLLSQRETKAFSGSVSSAGVLSRSNGKSTGGVVGSVGQINRFNTKQLVGTLPSSGSVSKRITKQFIGTLNTTGAIALIRLLPLNLNGSMATSGAVKKVLGKSFSGTMGSSGVLRKVNTRQFAGVLTTSGSLSSIRVFVLTFSGAMGSSGMLVRRVSKAAIGVMATSGTLASTQSKKLSGTLTSSGVKTTSIARVLSGTMASSAVLNRRVVGQLTGAMGSTGAMRSVVAHAFSGTVASVGVLSKSNAKHVVGTLTSAGVLTIRRVITLAVGGVLGTSGTLSRYVGKRLVGALPSSGVVSKRSSLHSGSVLAVSGDTTKNTAVTRSGVLGTASTLAVPVNKYFSGVVSSAGSMATVVGHNVGGALVVTGSISKRLIVALDGVLSVAGDIVSMFVRHGLQPVGKATAKVEPYDSASSVVVLHGEPYAVVEQYEPPVAVLSDV